MELSEKQDELVREGVKKVADVTKQGIEGATFSDIVRTIGQMMDELGDEIIEQYSAELKQSKTKSKTKKKT